MEIHCFLLTDMLLVCKPSTKKGGATLRVIRQPYLVDRLVVNELNRETPSLALIYKNEFDMAIAAFILQNNDPKKLKVNVALFFVEFELIYFYCRVGRRASPKRKLCTLKLNK